VGLAYGGGAGGLADLGADGRHRTARRPRRRYCFVFNLAIAVGAAASGLVVDALGVPSGLWLGAALVLLVLLTVRRAPAQ
jgi:uncharacterized membrane protein YoaK (UPF0700 family)